MKKLLLCLLLFALPANALAASDRTRVYDLSADVLESGKREWGLFFGRYTRGLGSGLQISTHFGGNAFAVLNGNLKYRFLELEAMRASIELGFTWIAPLSLVVDDDGTRNVYLVAPISLRTTVPLTENLDVTVGLTGRSQLLRFDERDAFTLGTRAELALVRYDDSGAWILSGVLPLLVMGNVEERGREGTIVLDDVSSWGLKLARDQAFGDSFHVRLGLGYRNTPGIFLLESLDHLLVELDLYWR